MHDVIVVGAGPVGLYAASLCGQAGMDFLVIEEHKNIGKPVHCSGLVSGNLEKFVKIRRDFLDNVVNKAVLHSPLGTEITLKKRGTAAFVIDRGKFDGSLSRGMESRILMGSKISRISVKDRVKVWVGEQCFESRLLLGCDGVNSAVARHFHSHPREVLQGLIAITKEKNSSKKVDIWVDKNLAREGFLWRIPRGKTTEYGMWSRRADFRILEKFFNLKNYEKRAGLVPLGPCKTYFKRTLLVGGAAAQAKPWSGGGVIYGFTAAKIACDVIKEALERNDFSEKFLERYENLWRREMGLRIEIGMHLRKWYEKMGNLQVEIMFRTLRLFERKMSGLDMDFVFPRI